MEDDHTRRECMGGAEVNASAAVKAMSQQSLPGTRGTIRSTSGKNLPNFLIISSLFFTLSFWRSRFSGSTGVCSCAAADGGVKLDAPCLSPS